MERIRPRLLRRGQTLALVALVLAVTVQGLFYPEIATSLYILFSGRTGWDGSGLEYVRSTIVLPVGLALICGTVVAAFILARRRPQTVTGLILVSWILNGVLMAASIAWYARIADKG